MTSTPSATSTPAPGETTPDPARVHGRRRRPTRLSWVISLGVIALAVVGLIVTGSSSPSSHGGGGTDPTGNPLLPSTSKLVGHRLPDATFTRLDGTPASFADYRGKPLVVNFWQVDCAPCRTEMPDLERLHQRFGNRVSFLGLNTGDSLDKARANSPSFGISYDVVVDPGQSIIRSFGGVGLPTTILVRADGTVARVSGPGAVAPAKLERWINQDLLS